MKSPGFSRLMNAMLDHQTALMGPTTLYDGIPDTTIGDVRKAAEAAVQMTLQDDLAEMFAGKDANMTRALREWGMALWARGCAVGATYNSPP